MKRDDRGNEADFDESGYGSRAAMAQSIREAQKCADEIKEAWTDLVTGLIAVSPHLSQPYPDDARWTPWTRFVEHEIGRMDEAVKRALETTPR